MMSNGFRPSDDPENIRLKGLINLYCIFMAGFALVVGSINAMENNWGWVIVLWGMFTLAIIDYLLLRYTGKHNLVSGVILISMGGLCTFAVATGGVDNNGHLWIFAYPVFTLYTFGLRKGLIALVGVVLALAVVLYYPNDLLLSTEYLPTFKLRLLAAFTGVIAVAALAEYSRQKASEHLIALMDEQRREAKRREELEEQLRHAQKMEAVGRLAGGIAHDFNNLLTGITSYATFAKEAIEEDTDVRRDIEVAISAAEKAGRLTSQLLAFSRKQVYKPRVLRVDTLISEMARLLRLTAGDLAELNVVAENDLGFIRADPIQVEQVILNLVANSRDAMQHRGAIEISMRNVSLQDTDCTAEWDATPGDFVSLEVTDAGIGMDEEIKQRMFEPFFTTKEKSKGTGLGLSTVFGIIKQNRGVIQVDTTPGGGTSIKTFWPREYDIGRVSSLPCRPSVNRAGRVILLAEDEDIVRRSIVRMLTDQHYQVLETSSGEEALEITTSYKGEIDLLLSDVIMPGMNGIELANCFAKERPNTPVLLMSGYTEDAISDHGELTGDMQFLPKPFSSTKLLQKVANAIDRGRRASSTKDVG